MLGLCKDVKPQRSIVFEAITEIGDRLVTLEPIDVRFPDCKFTVRNWIQPHMASHRLTRRRSHVHSAQKITMGKIGNGFQLSNRMTVFILHKIGAWNLFLGEFRKKCQWIDKGGINLIGRLHAVGASIPWIVEFALELKI